MTTSDIYIDHLGDLKFDRSVRRSYTDHSTVGKFRLEGAKNLSRGAARVGGWALGAIWNVGLCLTGVAFVVGLISLVAG